MDKAERTVDMLQGLYDRAETQRKNLLQQRSGLLQKLEVLGESRDELRKRLRASESEAAALTKDVGILSQQREELLATLRAILEHQLFGVVPERIIRKAESVAKPKTENKGDTT